MNAPPELHFGPAELARLALLKQTTTPADLEPVRARWRGQPLVLYLSPLSWPSRLPGQGMRRPAEMVELRKEYTAAFRARTEFATLFMGADPFFTVSLSTFEGVRMGNRLQDEGLCHLIVQQGNTQLHPSTSTFQNWPSLYRTLVQPEEGSELAAPSTNGRPFIRLMSQPHTSALLYRYVEYVAMRMAKACRANPSAASPVIWLGYEDWNMITFYDKARVVLAAKEYEEYIGKVAHAHQMGLGASSVEAPWHLRLPPLASLSHQHAPNLTSRQARRSAISQESLRRRWTAM